MIKINGWQRIGIVLSLVWLVFIAVVIWRDYQWVGHYHRTGYYFKHGGLSEHCFDLLLDQDVEGAAKQQWEKECSNSNLVTIKWIHTRETFGVIFGPIAALWIAAYFVVYTMKWIAAGFKQPYQ